VWLDSRKMTSHMNNKSKAKLLVIKKKDFSIY
jgi:hypothetical protein